MNSALLKQMADDLNITMFNGEHLENYCHRVLYSSLSLWLKTICLDGVTKETQSSHSISKHYHRTRGEFILNNLLDFFPGSKEWFYKEGEDHPVNFIRARLIHSMDILNINDDSRLHLSKKMCIPINIDLSKVFGIPSGENYFSSGISIVQRDHNSDYIRSYETIEDFYNSYLNNIKFTKDEWTAPKEYFNPFIKTNTIYKSWCDTPPATDIYISRLSDKFNQRVHFMEKNYKGTIYSHRMNEFIVESGLLGKFLFLIRHKSNNPIHIQLTIHNECFLLERSVKSFYGEEEKFIQSFGWPQNSMFDLLNWCFPSRFYSDITQMLKNLFIVVDEVHYES